MEPVNRLPKKDYYRIVVICGLLILLASIEVLAKAKDLDYFNYVNRSLGEGGAAAVTYGDFVVSLMASYLARILVPIGLGLNSYFAFMRSGISRVFIWSWGLFTFAALAFHVLSLELTSLLYYLSVLLYILLLYTLIRLSDLITATRRGL